MKDPVSPIRLVPVFRIIRICHSLPPSKGPFPSPALLSLNLTKSRRSIPEYVEAIESGEDAHNSERDRRCAGPSLCSLASLHWNSEACIDIKDMSYLSQSSHNLFRSNASRLVVWCLNSGILAPHDAIFYEPEITLREVGKCEGCVQEGDD